MATQRLIIGITGASGTIYGIQLLEALKSLPIETHLVVTKAGQLARTYETEVSLDELKALADVYHPPQDIAASIASGSFKTLGMIVAPCSMNTLGEIAHGVSNQLLTRAADVVLKERRRLVLLPREAPLHQGHLKNMLAVTEMGGIIYPPVPAFYHKPRDIAAMVDETVGRVLGLFELETPLLKVWKNEV
ncbi:MAG: UbiX family flavin prenyltransferase [Gammaproteobacteria bacterium]|nr:UbiX family flavin prenyltransferase [Gammaproteobacteria bacterium]